MATLEHPLKYRIYDRLDPEQLERLERKIAERHQRRMAAQQLREWRATERMIALQFNEEHPGGCERCGEHFGVENAEVVDPAGTHLIIHVECITDSDRMA
ncbi:MAG: hypothetical protein GY906_10215 [bacterium]|nr:hypothetical protein [bacterium]